MKKVTLTYADGRSEDVRLPKREVVKVKGRSSQITEKGVGIGTTARGIYSPKIQAIPVKEQIQYWNWPMPQDMDLPLYIDFENVAALKRAEIVAQIIYRASDGLAKNVNVMINLLGPPHPWLKKTNVEKLADGVTRVHFTTQLPRKFAGRPVEQLVFQSAHLIDSGLSEIVTPVQVRFLPK